MGLGRKQCRPHSMTPGLMKQQSSDTGISDSAFSRRPLLWFCLCTLIFTGVVLLLQDLSGCFRSELSGYPDEPAHLITGMMVRDYVVSGMKTSPMAFAENYYLHYPKVSFGIWPPLFHFVEGAWFLVFPPTKVSAFALQAVITGLLAAAAAIFAGRMFGWVLGVLAGLLFTALPSVQSYTEMIMADNLMALMGFLAMLQFIVWLRSDRMRDALLMGVLIGLAVMTKSNGAAVGLMPVIGLVLMRRYRKLWSPSLILAGILALAIAMPWQILAIKLWTSTVDATPYSAAYAFRMFTTHLRIYASACGVILLPFTVAGIIRMVVLPYFRKTLDPVWAAAAALLGGMFLFGFAPLPPEPRYHVASMAVMMVFAMAGLDGLIGLLTPRFGFRAMVVPSTAVIILLLYGFVSFRIPQRLAYGFTDLAAYLVSGRKYENSVMLVSSENFGEGMFIPEIALREPRPGHYVLRASKVLSQSRWNLDSYQLLYSTPEDLMRYLSSIPVKLVVIDNGQGPVRVPHQDLLKQTIARYSDQWKPVSYPNARGNIAVYEYVGAAQGGDKVKVDLRYTLKKILE